MSVTEYRKYSTVTFGKDKVRLYVKSVDGARTLWIHSDDIRAATYAAGICEQSIATFDLPEDNNEYGTLLIISAETFLDLYKKYEKTERIISIRAVISRLIEKVTSVTDSATGTDVPKSVPSVTKISVIEIRDEGIDVFIDDENVAYFKCNDKKLGHVREMLYEGKLCHFVAFSNLFNSKNEISLTAELAINNAIHTHMARRFNKLLAELEAGKKVPTSTPITAPTILVTKDTIGKYVDNHSQYGPFSQDEAAQVLTHFFDVMSSENAL